MVIKPTMALGVLPMAALAWALPAQARKNDNEASIGQFRVASLVIRPDGSEFVIGTERAIPAARNEPRQGVVRLGTGLSFDAVMFARDGQAIPEATHAQGR